MIIQKGKDRLWELVYKINGKAMAITIKLAWFYMTICAQNQ